MHVPLGGRMHKTLVVVLLVGVGCGTGASARRVTLAKGERDAGVGHDGPTLQSCWEEHCEVVAGKGLVCRQTWNVKDCGPKPESKPAVARDSP